MMWYQTVVWCVALLRVLGSDRTVEQWAGNYVAEQPSVWSREFPTPTRPVLVSPIWQEDGFLTKRVSWYFTGTMSCTVLLLFSFGDDRSPKNQSVQLENAAASGKTGTKVTGSVPGAFLDAKMGPKCHAEWVSVWHCRKKSDEAPRADVGAHQYNS